MADDEQQKDKWDSFRQLPKAPIEIDSKKIAKRVRKLENATVKHAQKFIIRRWNNLRNVRANISLWFMAIGVLITAVGVQWLFYQDNHRTFVGDNQGTYAEAVLGPATTLNPLFASTSAENAASQLIFSRLMNYDSTGNINYDVARQITVNSDETAYKVQLRDDVVWHDGQKLTAEDVMFTIAMIQDKSVRSSIGGWDNITATLIDDHTIEFKLVAPYAAFRHALNFPILPEHILGAVNPIELNEHSFSQNPVGSGPFRFRFMQDMSTQESRLVVHLARNDNFYKSTPKIDKFQLHIYNSRERIITALALNEVNAAADFYASDAKSINQKRYNIYTQPVKAGVYALFNTKSDILSDRAIRRALRLATDTDAIRDSLPMVTNALHTPFVIGQIKGALPGPPAFDKDLASKQLTDNGWILGENGTRSKGGVQLRLSVAVSNSQELESVASILVSQWREVGVAVDIKVFDIADITQNAVQNILQTRNFDVLVHQYTIGSDPDVYAYWHSSQASEQGLNFSNYSNVVSDDALSSARLRANQELRHAKYVTFAKQWMSDVPAIGLYQAATQYASSYNVQSFDVDSSSFVSSTSRYTDVEYWSAGKRSVYKTP
jgi:peptide/nickel transport system substrate-binding protein